MSEGGTPLSLRWGLAAALTLALAYPAVAAAAPGDLDPTFGTGGTLTTAVGPGLSDDRGHAVAIQSDGKIVVAGTTSANGGDFAVARYNADGTLDTSFGGGDGIFTTPVGPGSNTDIADAVAIQPGNGNIFVAGRVDMGSTGLNPTGADFGLVSLTTNGTLDTNFDGDGTPGNGIVTTAIAAGTGEDEPHAVAIQPSDGKIVVGGTSGDNFALARYSATDGKLDTSFGTGGKVTTDFNGDSDTIQALAVTSTQIVAAGEADDPINANADFGLARYNVSDGGLDSGFGTGGKVTTNFSGTSDDIANGVAIQPDGMIVAAGESNASGTSGQDFALARYSSSDGTLDTSFDGDGTPGNGKFTTAVAAGTNNDIAHEIAVQNSGAGMTIVAGGEAAGDFAVVRYDATDGKLDMTFSGDGEVTTPIGSGSLGAQGMAIDAASRIVAAGAANPGSGNFDFALARYDGAKLFTVNETGDQSDQDGNDHRCDRDTGTTGDQCTLRAAIEQANGTPGRDTIWFNLPANTTVVPATALPSIDEDVEIDGCNGATNATDPCVGLANGPGGDGLDVTDGTPTGSAVRGMAITGFPSKGVFVGGGVDGFVATNDWFGEKLDGSVVPNGTGLDLQGDSATIGGTAASARNVFAGNTIGVAIRGGDSNQVLGNYFGVKDNGTTAAPNNIGVRVVGRATPGPDDATGNVIGASVIGPAATSPKCDGGCNVIQSSIDDGIDLNRIGGEDLPSVGTTVKGNFIGLRADGLTASGNDGRGIQAGSSQQTTIGGPAAGDRNYISGNDGRGVQDSAGDNGLLIRNNFFGLNEAGSAALPNFPTDVELLGSPAGDPATVRDNRFAGSGTVPTNALTLGPGTAKASVTGNVFGLGTSNQAFGFGGSAISAQGSQHTIGGSGAGQGNTIANAGGGAAGITLDLADHVGVRGNMIQGNSGPGIRIKDAATANTIGGDSAAEQNVISNNGGDAIELLGNGTDGNLIGGNIGGGNGSGVGDLFIDLVGTNGAGNGTSGPNAGIGAPVVTVAGATFAFGTAAPGATVRLFKKATSATSEIEAFVDSDVADAAGHWHVDYVSALPNGKRVAATQTDASGNTSELSAVRLTDVDPPQTRIRKGPSGPTTDRTPTFKFKSDEAGSTFKCKIDGKAYRRCTSPKTLKQLSFGRHTFRVKAKDKAGNTDLTPAKRTFKVVH